MADIIELKAGGDGIGEGRELDPDAVLTHAAGAFSVVVVLGLNNEGELDLRSSHGAQETLYWLKRAEMLLLTGRDLMTEDVS